MVKSSREITDVNNIQSIPQIENTKQNSWAGRLVQLLSHVFSGLYSSIFKLKAYSLSKDHTGNEIKFSLKAENASNDGHSGLEHLEEGIVRQIEQAEKKHQKELEALHCVQREQAYKTAGLLRGKIKTLVIILNQLNDQSGISPEQRLSFLDEVEKLNDLLDKKAAILRLPAIKFGEAFSDQKELSADQMMGHLREIFDSMKAVLPQIKAFNHLLVKGTPEHKQFVTHVQKLVAEVNQQQKVHRNPSNDSYLRMFQINVEEASNALQILKEKLSSLQEGG